MSKVRSETFHMDEVSSETSGETENFFAFAKGSIP